MQTVRTASRMTRRAMFADQAGGKNLWPRLQAISPVANRAGPRFTLGEDRIVAIRSERALCIPPFQRADRAGLGRTRQRRPWPPCQRSAIVSRKAETRRKKHACNIPTTCCCDCARSSGDDSSASRHSGSQMGMAWWRLGLGLGRVRCWPRNRLASRCCNSAVLRWVLWLSLLMAIATLTPMAMRLTPHHILTAMDIAALTTAMGITHAIDT